MPNDISEMRARGRAAVKHVRAKAFRIVHGKPWVRITKDVPCTECERQYCRENNIRFPRPGWQTADWVHVPVGGFPPPHRQPGEPTQREALSQVAEATEALSRAASAAERRNTYPPSESPAESGGSGGSAPF
jgi:hypothetical protein